MNTQNMYDSLSYDCAVILWFNIMTGHLDTGTCHGGIPDNIMFFCRNYFSFQRDKFV